MGIGDEIMATAEARLRQKNDPRPVAFRGKDGRPRWHFVFDNNPRLSQTFEGAQISENRSGHRPYIERFDKRKFHWRPQICQPGELYFSDSEKEFGGIGEGHVVIEPCVKPRDGGNKDWGFDRWAEVVRANPTVRWLQVGPIGTQLLPGARGILTPTFRHAAAVIARARAFVGAEGGLHHAAAAVGKPAVVIFGGFIGHRVTGYATHQNLGEEIGCGSRLPCEHCRRALAAITPAMVTAALDQALR